MTLQGPSHGLSFDTSIDEVLDEDEAFEVVGKLEAIEYRTSMLLAPRGDDGEVIGEGW